MIFFCKAYNHDYKIKVFLNHQTYIYDNDCRYPTYGLTRKLYKFVERTRILFQNFSPYGDNFEKYTDAHRFLYSTMEKFLEEQDLKTDQIKQKLVAIEESMAILKSYRPATFSNAPSCYPSELKADNLLKLLKTANNS